MTPRTAWACLILLLGVLCEVWLARIGLMVAGWPLAALYLGVALGPIWGIWTGIAGCIASEVLLGRSWTALPLLVLLLPLIQFWRRHGDRRYLLIQMLPAGATGAVYAVWYLLVENWRGSMLSVDWQWVGLLAGAGSAASCLGGPLAWRLLDIVALLVGLPRFYQTHGVRDAQREDDDA